MSYRCLADFLEELGHAGELVRVEAPVDASLEVAEIAARLFAAEGPAVLFGAVRGSRAPLLVNLFGDDGRVCRALGVSSVDVVAQRIAQLAQPTEAEGWFERLKTAPHQSVLSNLPPRRIKSGVSQQVVRLGSDIDLGELPLVQGAADEAAPSITAAIVVTADPDSHEPVFGHWDLQRLGPDRLAVGWAAHDEPARLLAEYGRRGEKMPLVVVLGGDPALLLAAMSPVPPGTDIYALAGLLREKPIDVIACRSVDLHVPADAEIILEGYVDPTQPPAEAGPWSTPTGNYGPRRAVPVMQLTAATHRANPIFPAIVYGRPPHEETIIRRTMQRVFLPLVKMAIPELVDYDLPAFASARHWAVLAIRKTHAGQARHVANAAWAMRQLMFAKVLTIVDEGVDIHDQHQVLAAIATNMNAGRDVFFQQGPPDPLDVAAEPNTLGQKMAIDATAKLPGEHTGTWPEPTIMSEEIRNPVTERWEEYGLGPRAESES
ncbi:MAG TPA: UbiD family decarboxylase [Thermoguttaceae bacterium]|nr:UbiD family decarboxylase [Thermoguttaceae bacterium]